MKNIIRETKFFEENITEKKFGKYYSLLIYFISTYKTNDSLFNELIHNLISLKNNSIAVNDWNSFSWDGKVCLRKDFLMIIDNSIFKVGRFFPNLKDENGEFLINEDFEFLEDTEFIEKIMKSL